MSSATAPAPTVSPSAPSGTSGNTAPASPATAAAVDRDRAIVFEDVSKFYGEVLGVNRVDLVLEPGITGLVGPNGSGKTTLFNLAAGLLRPSRGRIRVLGVSPDRPEDLFPMVGYATQFDSFPRGVTGQRFVETTLRLHGFARADARDLADQAIARVGLGEAAHRKVAGYSKGMRQRIRLAQAIAHRPSVLLLDEPLNGLDPMARAEMIELFQQLAKSGLHVLVSSHILHEVDVISDQVVLLDAGYVVAEGEIRGVRSEMDTHPMQILVRCDRPRHLAALAFAEDGVVEAKLLDDLSGVLVRTRDADSFFLRLNRWVLDEGLRVDGVAPADEDVQSVYQYLIGSNGGPR